MKVTSFLSNPTKEVKTKPKTKPKPIKKVALIMGILFMVLGIIFMVLMFTSSDTAKPTYAVLVVALLTFGVNYLDKSRVLDR